MYSGERRKISAKDIDMVQNLIERCLQLYMSKKETVNTLLSQVNIEPCFTELVWKRLEEENPEFFKAYYTRLILKDQISRFNELLKKQVEMMNDQAYSCTMTTPVPQIHPMIQGASQLHAPLHTAPVFQPESMKKQVETMNDQAHSCTMATSIPQTLSMIQGASQHHAPLHTAPVFQPESMKKQIELVNDQTHSCTMTTSIPQILPMIQEASQHHAPLHTAPVFQPESTHSPLNPSAGRGVLCVQSMQHPVNTNTTYGILNFESMQHEVDINRGFGAFDVESMQHLHNSNTMFGVLDVESLQNPVNSSTTYGTLNVKSMQSNRTCGAFDTQSMQQRPVNSSTTLGLLDVESNSQSLTGGIFNTNMSIPEFLRQIPQDLSFPDLTANDSVRLDILERYQDSPFLATVEENLLDLQANKEQQDSRLDIDGSTFEDYSDDWKDWLNDGN